MSVGSSNSAADMDGATLVFAAALGTCTDVPFAVSMSLICNKVTSSIT
jgi:hypothetical protein